MPHAILLFSHGSLLCGAGENLARIARLMESRGDAPVVEVGYLNYSEPPFEEAFARCVRRGADEIVIAPYFLVAGYFVTASLPPRIAAMKQRYHGVRVRVAEALRAHERLAGALLACAERALPEQRWHEMLTNAPSFCRANPNCPLFGNCSHAGTEPAKGEAAAGAAPREALGDDQAREASTALLVMVHGSPHPDSNADVYTVVEMVRQRGAFASVEVGFMECNQPDIPTAIESCIAAGAGRVIAVPYFLHSGAHVAVDLPTLLEAAGRRWPDVKFLMGDYLGHDDTIADVLRDRVREIVE